MRLLKQSDTSKVIMFLMVSSTDHVTGATGVTPTVTISKNGGAFGSPTGTTAEVSSGWYKHTPSAADVGTLGPLCLHVTGTGADPVDLQYQVVAFDPYSATIGLPLRTWYVATTGSDSNDGLTPATAKLTISAAVTASSSGDTINIGAGTFSGQVDVDTANKYGLTLRGAGRTQTVITHTSTAIKAEDGLTVENLTATASSTLSGIDAQSKVNVTIRNCLINGNSDGLVAHGSTNLKIIDSEIVGTWDGLGIQSAQNYQIERCLIQTTGEYSWNGSAYTSDQGLSGVRGSQSVGSIRNSYVYALRPHNSTLECIGIEAGASTYLENVLVWTTVQAATVSGASVGVEVIDANGVCTLDGTHFITDTTSTNAEYNVRVVEATGRIIDKASNFVRTSFTGSGSIIDARSKMTDQGYTTTLATNLGTTNTRVDVAVSTRLASASYVGGSPGTGARTVTVTVNDGSTALEGAIVRMTEGANSYTATTNASGQCTFNVDDATYTVSIAKSGYSYTGTTLVVDGTETVTYSMTQISVSAPSAPGLTTAYLTTYNGQGTVEGSVVVSFKMEDGAGTSGYSYNQKTFTATSNASTGLLEVELVKSTQYSARRGNGEWVDFTTGSGSSYALPEVLGTP